MIQNQYGTPRGSPRKSGEAKSARRSEQPQKVRRRLVSRANVIENQAPPSPDYVSGPEYPPSPEYVPKHIYLEFMPPKDEILPAEEQPLPTAVSATIDLPGYVLEFDFEEDHEEDSEEDLADYPVDRGEDDNDDDESFDDDEEDDDDVEGDEY
nr:hypothetical protein [Tanacetum cinerariifolium]